MKIYQYQDKTNMCGENVKKYRREQDVSQTELAARIQTHGVILEQKSISRIEAGTRVVADYELFALSKALNVTIYNLLGLPNPK